LEDGQCSMQALFLSLLLAAGIAGQILPQCNNLNLGQYRCSPPIIDPETNEAQGCMRNNSVNVNCTVVNGVNCEGSHDYVVTTSCRYTNGYSFTKTMFLSVFLGNLGVDRFYLGYPTIGFLKLITFGGFLVGNVIDIILISTQVVKPADGSNYVFSEFGPRMAPVSYSENLSVS